MRIIDTHCHLDVTAFDVDRNQVLQHCLELQIKKIIIPAIQASGWNNLVSLCESENMLYPALGLHPMFTDDHKTEDITLLETYLEKHRPVAVGEIGLDFYIKNPDKEKQLSLFKQQLQLAKRFNLPVILHTRKAHDQVLQCLKEIKVIGGVSHAFNGSLQQAKQYIELGFKLGFGGTLTYANSTKIRQLARDLPLSSIVLETDAPDMTVASHRGERNSPEYIIDSLKALADARNMSTEEVAEVTTRNAEAIFCI